jgi:hypothetical protein
MTSPAEILPGVIFYSYLSAERKEKVCFWNHHTLILQVSGQLVLETSNQNISMTGGELLLIGKNQLGTLTKTPLPGANYETIVISLQEELLRKIVPKVCWSTKYPSSFEPIFTGVFSVYHSLCTKFRGGYHR